MQTATRSKILGASYYSKVCNCSSVLIDKAYLHTFIGGGGRYVVAWWWSDMVGHHVWPRLPMTRTTSKLFFITNPCFSANATQALYS